MAAPLPTGGPIPQGRTPPAQKPAPPPIDDPWAERNYGSAAAAQNFGNVAQKMVEAERVGYAPEQTTAYWEAGLPRYSPRAAENVADSRRYEDPYLADNLAAMNRGRAAAQQMTAPQMAAGSIDGAQQGEWRDRQMRWLQQLEAQAAGTAGPSDAEQALQSETQAALAMQSAIGATSNVPAAVAARRAAMGRAGVMQEASGAVERLRAGEMEQARQALHGALGDVRSSDIAMAGAQAQLAQRAGETNLQSQLDTQAQIDEMTRYYTSTGLSLEQAQQQAWQEYDRLRLNTEWQYRAAAAGVAIGAQQVGTQAAGAAISGIGALGAAAGNAFAKRYIDE